MEKVRPWCGQPSDRGRLKNRTDMDTEKQTGGCFVMRPRSPRGRNTNNSVTVTVTRVCMQTLFTSNTAS